MLQCVRHRFPGVKIRCSGQAFDYLLQNIVLFVLFFFLCRFTIFATECCLSLKPQKVKAMCTCQVCECFIENFVFWPQLEFLLVPKHCQVTSKLFTIKPVHTHPHNYEEITSLNVIYKIEEDHLLLENVDKNTNSKKNQGDKILTKLEVPSKMILKQINKTKHQLSLLNTQSTFKLSGK